MTIKDNGKATQKSVTCPRCNDGRVFAAGIPELAKRTGLSETFLYDRAGEGTLVGCRRIGRRFLIHIETFEKWLADGWGEEF
jgi:excisionase family DNA binding protein